MPSNSYSGSSYIRLNVNIDHIATIRQARRTFEPSVVAAAVLADIAGASGITVHLRGDRRHIQDDDVRTLRQVVKTHLNLEMAATDEMIEMARAIKVDVATLVPERAEEVTTEGGLDVVSHEEEIRSAVERIADSGVIVSIFIDPDLEQIEASHRVGARQIEICTATYAELTDTTKHASAGQVKDEIARISKCAARAGELGLMVAAGHGLTYRNVAAIAEIDPVEEFEAKNKNPDLKKEWNETDKPDIETFEIFQKILSDAELVFSVLVKLDQDVGEAIQKGQSVAEALHKILLQKEIEGGFPDKVPKMSTVISPNEFLDKIKAGYQYLDIGAGFEHGFFSHRLQWYIIASVLQKKGVNLMALPGGQTLQAYYIKSGAIRKGTLGESIWRHLVDRNLPDPTSNATKPESLQELLKAGEFENLIKAEVELPEWLNTYDGN